MKTSIIILTHNRSSLLKKCLDHLVPQLAISDEITIVNNNSTKKETKKIVDFLKGYKKRQIRYIFNKTKSIAEGRNKGLKAVSPKAQIIAFLDDDCFPSKDWLKNIKKEHQVHQNRQVIQGKVISVPKNNLYARTTGITYQNWLRSNLLNKNLLATLDSKNVSFKVKVFRSGLLFNEKFSRSSDIELGLRLRKKGFKIGYSPKIKAYHQERTNLISFLKQHLNIAHGESKVDIKLLPKRYRYHLASLIGLIYQLIKEKEFLSLLLLLFLIPIILISRMAVFLSRPLPYKSSNNHGTFLPFLNIFSFLLLAKFEKMMIAFLNYQSSNF